MLSVQNISKRYRHTESLRGISLEIPERSITGIIGPNGAGKSTLLRIIAGFENSDTGKVLHRGTPLSSFSQKKVLFSYMPEQLDIYPEYRVADFVDFIHKSTGHIDDDLLSVLHLPTVSDKRIGQLSKGYRQRLKLFFALCNRKQVVILDEPFDGFDPIQLIEIRDLLKKENEQGRDFIISIHQLHDAEKICSYYVLLDEGQVVAEGDMSALRRRFGNDSASLEELFIRALR